MSNDNVVNKDLVLLKFGATWCFPCKTMAPILEGVLNDFNNIKLVSVDVDQDADFSVKYGVRAVPTLILLKDNKEINRITGARDVTELKEFLTT